MPHETTKQVPAEALRFDVGPLQFADGDQQAGGTQAPVKIFARTAKPVEHWYWGRIVHDMAGLNHKDRIQLDWCHRYDQNIGYLDKFDADAKKGLTVEGQLVSFREDDIAAEVLHRGKAGVPYEASIDWTGPARIEEISAGVKVQVNGFTFEGPGFVAREWTLRAVAICPHGVDGSTQTKFASPEAGEISVTLFSESDMSKDQTSPPADNPQADANKPAESKPAEKPPVQADANQPDARAEFTAELKRFTDRFGAENGAKWLAEGKTFAEALELHAAALADQLKAKDEQLAAANQKLSAVDRGEESPVTFSQAAGEGKDKPGELPAKFAHLGESRAKFAAGIKLPARK